MKSQEEQKLDAEGDQVGDQDRDRHRQPREVDLAEQLGVVDEGVGGLGDAVGEVSPDDRAGHVEQELRQAVGGQLGDLAEDESEGDGGQQRLDQVPQRPQDGLLVDRDEVAPHEQHHQVAVAPQVVQVQLEQVPLRLDDQVHSLSSEEELTAKVWSVIIYICAIY